MDAGKKIKICFVAPKAYPLFNPDAKNVKDPFGGSEVDLHLLALELAKDNDFEVSFITADYGQADDEIIRNVKIIKSLDFDRGWLRGAMRVWQAMRNADARIYMLKTASPGVPLAALFCRLHRRAFVYRTASQLECNGEYIRKHPLLGKAFRTSLRMAKLVFTQNVADKDSLRRTMGVDSVFVKNGHYINRLGEKNRDIILWVGRSDPRKKPGLFIDIAQQLPKEKFAMICPRALGDEKYGRLVSRAKTIPNLEFIRLIPFQQTNGFFRRAKVFVCTSEDEGFPNTYIQACINAVPIVSLNINPDAFLSEHGCGLCCGGDFRRLVDSLRFMLAEDRYIEFGKKARIYAEQNHDITKIAGVYKKLFCDVA